MKYFYFLAFLFALSTRISTAQTSDRSSLKKDGYQTLYVEDFNGFGTPNPKDWLFRKNIKMGGSSAPENVVLGKATDGTNANCLLIKFTYDSTAKAELQFKGGGVVSTHNFGYGYYETRVKLYGGKPDLAGLHQSFWSMGLTGTNEAEGAGVRDALVKADLMPQENRVLEIDGFELDSKNNKLGQNYHIYYPSHLSSAPIPNHFNKDLSKWITIAYEWLPDRINYYAEGVLVGVKKIDGVWNAYAPQNFWFTALPVSLASWGGLKIPPMGTAMQVDYFKFYAKNLPRVNRIGNADFEYKVPNKNLNYPVAWIVSRINNNPEAVKVVTDSTQAKLGSRYLMHQLNKEYKASTKQIIEYIPNGVYTFSAWVKSSGGQKNVNIKIQSGSKTKVLNIKASNDWVKVSLPQFKVTKNNTVISINSDANAGNWLMVDHVELSEFSN